MKLYIHIGKHTLADKVELSIDQTLKNYPTQPYAQSKLQTFDLGSKLNYAACT
jgi:hypothetical protein